VDFPHFPHFLFIIYFYYFLCGKKIYIASQTMCVCIYIYIYIFKKLLLLLFIERCFRLKIFSRKTNDIPFLWLIA
jgi:hypothetical protein